MKKHWGLRTNFKFEAPVDDHCVGSKTLLEGAHEWALDYEAHLSRIRCGEVARRGGEFSAGLGAFLEKRPPEFS